MTTIQNIKEGTDLRLATRNTGVRSPDAAAVVRSVESEPPVSPAVAPEPASGDPEAARKFADQVQQALDQATGQPNQIKFRMDDASNGFVLEIRSPDGTLLRQFPPEIMLNLRRQLDELSGMVVDTTT